MVAKLAAVCLAILRFQGEASVMVTESVGIISLSTLSNGSEVRRSRVIGTEMEGLNSSSSQSQRFSLG